MKQSQRELSSRDNPAVKRYVQLASSHKARREQRLFVTEGVKLTAEAFSAGCRPQELFATEQAMERWFDELQPVAIEAENFYRISGPVADKLARGQSTQGAFGVFEMLDNGAADATINGNGKFLLLSSLQDPGNIGTILRAAAAFGADRVILSADCPDLYGPKVLRASMGGVFRAPCAVAEDLGAAVDALRAAGVTVYAAALDARALPIREAPLGAGGCAVVIGNEGGGIAPELIARCDRTLMIPMRPGSESLNAAMAAGIVLWEMNRESI